MHTIGFVVFPDFHLLGFVAVSVFETANRVLGEPSYQVTLLSDAGGLVSASAGFRIETQPFGEEPSTRSCSPPGSRPTSRRRH